jgi:hypothetical protein
MNIKHNADCKELQSMLLKNEGYVCICEDGRIKAEEI